MSEKRDAYVQKLKAKIDEWNADIDELTAKADQAEADAKIKYQHELEELRTKRQELEGKVADLQSAGESAWEELKQGVESSWEVWKASFSRAKTAFEKGYQEGREEGQSKKREE
ncbi:hypothetical protein [Desulfonatronum sp. SC1]|uniref:hypothetical protein n=1 Tax=Desulfonatronum sp. SC1 TaxID=2109626 RepID=UPI000D305399|nr:hypothetical protein [Desulfonatronum sp. SC1]PTN35338.1 hypothetical protein C6366_11385 [Desulfonatronum sp. SC1]